MRAQNILNDRFCDKKYYGVNRQEQKFYRKIATDNPSIIYYLPFKVFNKGY
jgi:hypothetical protein